MPNEPEMLPATPFASDPVPFMMPYTFFGAMKNSSTPVPSVFTKETGSPSRLLEPKILIPLAVKFDM